MLSHVDRAIIDLERTWWKEPGPKEAVIVERVGISPADYYGRLVELLVVPEAIHYDPLTVRRLRRFARS